MKGSWRNLWGLLGREDEDRIAVPIEYVEPERRVYTPEQIGEKGIKATGILVETDSPTLAAIASLCFAEGKVVHGEIDDQGNLHATLYDYGPQPQ